jgi:hypothetical protein
MFFIIFYYYLQINPIDHRISIKSISVIGEVLLLVIHSSTKNIEKLSYEVFYQKYSNWFVSVYIDKYENVHTIHNNNFWLGRQSTLVNKNPIKILEKEK